MSSYRDRGQDIYIHKYIPSQYVCECVEQFWMFDNQTIIRERQRSDSPISQDIVRYTYYSNGNSKQLDFTELEKSYII